MKDHIDKVGQYLERAAQLCPHTVAGDCINAEHLIEIAKMIQLEVLTKSK